MFNNEIAIFAERHNVKLEVAYTLPAIFDKIGEMMQMPVRQIISQATYSNIPLANYIVETAVKVHNEVK